MSQSEQISMFGDGDAAPYIADDDVVQIRWHLADREWQDSEQSRLSTRAAQIATARMLFSLPPDTKLRVRPVISPSNLPKGSKMLYAEPDEPAAVNYLVTLEEAS